MLEVTLLSLGRKGCQSWFEVIRQRIYGTWMKLAVSGEHFLTKGMAEIKKECKGGKQCKHRVTISFFVNGAGESEYLPIVIWKSNNPCCFKGVKKENLPVLYYSQPKCWMSGEILNDILQSLN